MKPGTYRAILVGLSILGSLLVYAATSQFGPGLSTDGARYLSTAENLAAGRGVIDYYYQPLVNWPPLYPLLLAGLHLLTGTDVFIIAHVINILAFGVIIWLSGTFIAQALSENYSLALLASIVMAISLPLIEVSANVATDPLFLITVLVWLLVAQQYAQTRRRRDWWLLVLLAAAASLLRYAGASLAMGGALLVFLVWRPQWRRSLQEAVAYGLLAAAPLAAWALLHNYRLTGLWLGEHLPAYPWGLFVVAVEKIFAWFVPQRILMLIPPMALLGLLLALLAIRSTRERWTAWMQRMLAAPLLPAAVFTLAYGAMLIFTISYPQHREPGSQRLHAMLLPTLLPLTIVTVQAFLPKLKNAKLWRTAGLALFALWLFLPLYRVAEYVRISQANGDASFYNLYNTRTVRESDIVAHLQGISLEPDDKVYSNNEAAAWFYLRHRIYHLPHYDGETEASLQAAMQEFDWPAPGDSALLLWFAGELDYKQHVPRPEAIRRLVSLEPVYIGDYGVIYVMEAD